MATTAVLGLVKQNLSTFLTDQVAIYWGVDQQALKLTQYMTAIHAVLQVAEKQQETNPFVKLWLQNITDASLVLEDLLEDYSMLYETQPIGLCAWLTRFSPTNICFRLNIGNRMKKITQRFDDIDEKRMKFGFHQGGSTTEKLPENDEWRQTTAAIIEPKVYGRDEDVKRIVEFLVRDAIKNEDLSIYPIVGMAGNGKTTLAQQVFHDHRVTTHFDLKLWVCVSDDFVIMKILSSIIESATGANPNLSTLESMRKKVQEVLQSKRYLLILDDVWNEDPVKWNQLKSYLQCRDGIKGASILVTTRSDKVASIMGTTRTAHRLLGLLDDDNFLLFKHHAFLRDTEVQQELLAIGKEIVRKCRGSPLASKVLGGLLRDKRKVKQWLSVKDSELTEGDHIMPALRLSYSNLRSPLKPCFSFCAIFPKDSVIEKEELIYLWMANGFIQSREKLEVEDVGNELWNELNQRCFFQEVKNDVSDGITFMMHDLFHDLAQSIMGEECMVGKAESMTNLSSRVHHLRFLYSQQPINVADLKNVEYLRTFIYMVRLPEQLLTLQAFSPLRALCIGYTSQFPDFKNLTHLRYLKIYWSHIKALPESVCRLQKLQILKLESCYHLLCLPKHLTQLQNLRHLVIKYCNSLTMMPPSMGELKCLKTLSKFIVDREAGFGLGELHDLQLGGNLYIGGLENVNSERDAKQANLIGKEDLNCLQLSWGYHGYSDGTCGERVLEALQPHSNIKSLTLNKYQGTQLPSWITVVKGLVHLRLSGCNNCKQLPPLGKLPNLTTLHVDHMKDMKYLDDTLYDDVSFKSLKKLTLEFLPNLERISRDGGVEILPLLSQLTISEAPKFKLPCLPSIEYLEVCDIEEEAFLSGIGLHLKTLRIYFLKKLKVLPVEVGRFNALEELRIHGCDELELCFPENALQGLTSLRKLEIWNCMKLKSLFEGVGLERLTALRDVSINFCPQLPEGLQCIPFLQSLRLLDVDSDTLLEWFGDMSSLRLLSLISCRKLTSLPNSISQLTKLQELVIYRCTQLMSLPNNFSQLTNLQELEISYCTQLTSLPNNFSQLTNLQKLLIDGCTELTSLPNNFSQLTNLQELHIDGCTQLTSLPNNFSQLTNLQKLVIKNCPKLRLLPNTSFLQLTNLKTLDISGIEEMTFCENVAVIWNKGKHTIQQWINIHA